MFAIGNILEWIIHIFQTTTEFVICKNICLSIFITILQLYEKINTLHGMIYIDSPTFLAVRIARKMFCSNNFHSKVTLNRWWQYVNGLFKCRKFFYRKCIQKLFLISRQQFRFDAFSKLKIIHASFNAQNILTGFS